MGTQTTLIKDDSKIIDAMKQISEINDSIDAIDELLSQTEIEIRLIKSTYDVNWLENKISSQLRNILNQERAQLIEQAKKLMS